MSHFVITHSLEAFDMSLNQCFSDPNSEEFPPKIQDNGPQVSAYKTLPAQH